jgi:outer membrane protein OmpA-like peptidoglycan-associated protein
VKKFLLPTLCLAFSAFLAAQTADELGAVLDTRKITYHQAARFILAAANVLPGGADAFTLSQGKGWVSRRAGADDPISLGGVSLLIMKAFGLKGSILYSLFPNPRYACRELVYLRIVQGRTDPGGRLDGREFLQILGRVLTHTGEEEAEPQTPLPAEEAAERQQVQSGEAPILFEENEANIVIQDTPQGRSVRLLNAVYFRADSAVLIEDAWSVLDELGNLLLARPGATVSLRAYTAPYGTREGRLAVSRSRADFCLDYLGTCGIKPERIQIELYGADQLPEWGQGPDGAFASVESFRCVEFIIHE